MKHARMISQKWMNVRRYGFRAAVLAALLMVICSMGAMAATHTVNTDSRVYRSPDLSSQYVALPEGMQVNLVATYNGWAMIENAGVYGYTNAAHLTENAESEAPQAAVITADTYVFQSPSLSSARLSVPQGMRIELVAVNGDWAMVRNGTAYAYIYADFITLLSEVEPTVAPTATPDYGDLLENAKDAVITANTFVFESPDLSSSYVGVSAGLEVRLLAENGQWALIEYNGHYGFAYASHVSEAATATPEPTAVPTPEPTAAPADDYLNSSAYSNEEKCYLFLTREMGLNTAAASGILANIYRESSFNPDAGSSYYGLCQWGGGRLTNLRSFCSSNGYSASSLEGQLRFLAHELEQSYSSVLSYLQGVDNSAQGAYDAGYYFCYNFERPANRESSSVSRGELARDTYYPKYA